MAHTCIVRTCAAVCVEQHAGTWRAEAPSSEHPGAYCVLVGREGWTHGGQREEPRTSQVPSLRAQPSLPGGAHNRVLSGLGMGPSAPDPRCS